jgi:hypothetical protein
MARTDEQQATGNSRIPPTSTQKKRSRGANNTAVELEQPAPAKRPKTTISKPKRQREADTAEPEQAASMKKARTASRNAKEDAQVAESPAAAQRLNRAHTKGPAAIEKRKRRTKAEIAADNAKADAEKMRQAQLTEENHRTMIRMDVEEDINRAETVAQTIRKFADLERNSESGEEFVGFHDAEGSDSDSDSHGEDLVKTVKLKVRFPSSLESEKLLTSANRSKSRLSKRQWMVVRRTGWVGRSALLLDVYHILFID